MKRMAFEANYGSLRGLLSYSVSIRFPQTAMLSTEVLNIRAVLMPCRPPSNKLWDTTSYRTTISGRSLVPISDPSLDSKSIATRRNAAPGFPTVNRGVGAGNHKAFWSWPTALATRMLRCTAQGSVDRCLGRLKSVSSGGLLML